MLDKKIIKREYKEKEHKMGVIKITNKANGKILIKSSKNIDAAQNRFSFCKKTNVCVEYELEEDFKNFGADNFDLEIIEILKPKKDPEIDNLKRLEKLEEQWINELSPFNERGYNDPRKLDA